MAFDWFVKFIKCADRMPDSMTMTLPSCLTKSAVYNLYCEQMAGKPLVVRATFVYDMWKKHFPHVIIPKVSFIMLRLYKDYFSKKRIVDNLKFSNSSNIIGRI